MIWNIYQEKIRDHYQNPRNKGVLENPDFTANIYNPSCGDSITFQGTLDDGKIMRLAFQGFGCVISQAVASMLTQKLIGLNLRDILLLNADFIKELIGIQLGPTRLKCALLPLDTLRKAFQDIAPNSPDKSGCNVKS